MTKRKTIKMECKYQPNSLFEDDEKTLFDLLTSGQEFRIRGTTQRGSYLWSIKAIGDAVIVWVYDCHTIDGEDADNAEAECIIRIPRHSPLCFARTITALINAVNNVDNQFDIIMGGDGDNPVHAPFDAKWY